MNRGIKTIIIPVRDLAAAKALYGAAGVTFTTAATPAWLEPGGMHIPG